jgi:hypothetical protein
MVMENVMTDFVEAVSDPTFKASKIDAASLFIPDSNSYKIASTRMHGREGINNSSRT